MTVRIRLNLKQAQFGDVSGMEKDEKRRAKLEKLLERLRRGETVQNRILRSCLGKEAYQSYSDACETVAEMRKDLKDKPDQVVEYERRLNEATFTYNRADSYSRRGNRAGAVTLFAKADTQFECVIEYLNDYIVGHHELEFWFDRNVKFDATNTPHGSPEEFPRCVTSRSHHVVSGAGMMKMIRSKRDLKIEAVEGELERLNADETAIDEAFRKKIARIDEYKKRKGL